MSYQGASDDDGDDALFFALVVAGAYFIYQFWRYRGAAAYGGGYFQPAPPPSDAVEGVLNILVPLQLSPTGAAFIEQQEGFRANPYPDGKGGRSIGYGHKIQAGDLIVPPITQAEAASLFAGDIAAAEKAVNTGLVVQVTQNQFDALVDLAFNIGAPAFKNSTLLRLLNSGDYAGAAAQFGQWVHSGGAVNSDLVARRALDQGLFQGS